ncbi:MAG: four helix bundle suffix domain-containing protein [Victivallaceae bacterium]|nr:four helix bundle suffix domain-containing protein [Victivallaceae bacterium]
MKERLAGPQGGCRELRSFQIARLIYDLTVRFCELYIDRQSRTNDQMVQAARSGVQNIAEGSQCAGTSKKFEIKLTNVARASLEELKLDYEDFLRQRNQLLLEPNHPALLRFKEKRCSTLEEVQDWIKTERQLSSPSSVRVLPTSTLAANAALYLLNLCCYLLDRQLVSQGRAFEEEGGFTERMHRIRRDSRKC